MGKGGMESVHQEAYRVKRRVTWVCAALNLLLAGLKLLLGVVGQSQALVADGIHSLSDLASDAMVLVVIRIASEEADEEHPYGHARFETVATLILGLLLLSVSAGIVLDAADRIVNPELLSRPGFLALAGAGASIVVKEWMFWYNMKAARQLDSGLLRANAWHHRSDAISSVIVLIGIAGAMAGYPVLDAIGAIGVSLLIEERHRGRGGCRGLPRPENTPYGTGLAGGRARVGGKQGDGFRGPHDGRPGACRTESLL
jgi:cation diffusion facilitator family transporter